uniref:Uncharacterized protein n=1 Tax=Rhizophora mucronata TaxID=61149 RepID=A0A2P2QR78_RHIMU
MQNSLIKSLIIKIYLLGSSSGNLQNFYSLFKCLYFVFFLENYHKIK